jgi:serine phosphatase RsbU (regulator of sigma subunit)
LFGSERLERSAIAAQRDGEPDKMFQTILAEVREFSAGEPQSDDQTAIMITRL